MRLNLEYSGSKEYERVFTIDLINSGNMELFRSMDYVEIDAIFKLNQTIHIEEEEYVVKSIEKSIKNKEFFVDINVRNVNDIESFVTSSYTTGYNYTYLSNT